MPDSLSFTPLHQSIFDTLDIAPDTKSDYLYRTNLFKSFLAQTPLNPNTYLEYKKYLFSRTDFTTSTKNKYLIVAKICLKELNRRGLIPQDLTQNIKGFSQSKKHKRQGLTEAEIQTLTSKLSLQLSTPKITRLRAILALLALQGLRQIEIVRLDVTDLDLNSQTALITAKGSTDKEVISLHPQTKALLQAYLISNHKASGPLFTSLSNFAKDQRLTTRGLRKITKSLLKDLNIDKTVHGFRHYFTTQLLKTYKGDLLEVANYTRHKSLGMLQVYNDKVKADSDLPRYYQTFNSLKF